MLEVVWTRRAEDHAQRIFAKLDEYSPRIAELWLEGIGKRAELLARFPSKGSVLRRQKPADELLRRDRSRLVTRAGERVKVMVGGNDPAGLRSNRAIGEGIIILVSGDGMKAKAWADELDVSVQLSQQLEQALHILPASAVGVPADDLLILEQNGGGNGDRDTSIEESLGNSTKRERRPNIWTSVLLSSTTVMRWRVRAARCVPRG